MFLKLRISLREAIRSLLGSKQRTLLALLGIVIGIASVIAMVSVGNIVKNEALRQFQDMGTDFITIGNLGEVGSVSGSTLTLTMVPKLQELCPALVSMTPYSIGFSKFKYRGNLWGTSILGVAGNFSKVNRLNMMNGRPISELDQEMYNCVLGSRITRLLREVGITNPLGLKVTIYNNVFTVIGCLKLASDNALRPIEINDGVLIPYVTMKRITRQDKIDAIVGRLAPEATTDQASIELRRAIGRVLKNREPDINSAQALIEQMNKQMDLLTLLLGVVGSISLVVGGVGVMNVMLVSVSERRREIGIRRSIGAKRRDIQAQFLIESMLLCLVGGILGISIGVGGAYGIARYQAWAFEVAPEAIWLGVGVSMLVGIFFGYYPARQASRLRIIESLRAS